MVFSVCFPASANVQLASGESQPISSLRAYDQLQTLGLAKNGQNVTKVKESQFYTYLHFEKEVSAEFLVLSCEKDLVLVISEAHILFKRSAQGNKSFKAEMARTVEIGDSLLHLNGDKVVENVRVLGIERKICLGAFAPLTKSGTLIVDGFLVSSYAHVDSQAKAHVSMAPLRLWYQLNARIGKHTKIPKSGVHAWAKTLASIYGLS